MDFQSPIHDYYEDLAPRYDEDRFGNSYGRYIHQQEIAIMNRLMPVEPTGPTLDLGCGTGRLLQWATHGLDYSPAMIEEAKKKYPQHILQAGSAWETPYEDHTFHTVYSFHLLMHLQPQEIEAVFQEAARIIGPGGRFIFDIPSKKRRELVGHKADGWHAAQSLSLKEIKWMDTFTWKLQRYRGVLFLPVHRLPKGLRAPLRWADDLLCRSPWREYASYMVVELIRL